MSPLPVQYNLDELPMGCFLATKDALSLQVCEFIVAGDVANDSDSWADVSSWYWQTVLSSDSSGWWSYVVAENVVSAL
jgi:hypothetical protein